MDKEKIEFPKNFICPISQEVMKDPVITSDGHTFQRKAITEWFSKNKIKTRNPLTNLELKSKKLLTNFTLKNAIQQFQERMLSTEKTLQEKRQLEKQVEFYRFEYIRLLEDIENQKSQKLQKQQPVQVKPDEKIKQPFEVHLAKQKESFSIFKQNILAWKQQFIRKRYQMGQIKQYSSGCYVGQLKNNARSGLGIFHYKDQSKYEGMWKKNKRNGFGMMGYTNGNHYQGMWKNNEREGFGILRQNDGDIYEGMWKGDERNGFGIAINHDGNTYEGQWLANQKNGQGILYNFPGQKIYGKWSGDQKVEENMNEQEAQQTGLKE